PLEGSPSALAEPSLQRRARRRWPAGQPAARLRRRLKPTGRCREGRVHSPLWPSRRFSDGPSSLVSLLFVASATPRPAPSPLDPEQPQFTIHWQGSVPGRTDQSQPVPAECPAPPERGTGDFMSADEAIAGKDIKCH